MEPVDAAIEQNVEATVAHARLARNLARPHHHVDELQRDAAAALRADRKPSRRLDGQQRRLIRRRGGDARLRKSRRWIGRNGRKLVRIWISAERRRNLERPQEHQRENEHARRAESAPGAEKAKPAQHERPPLSFRQENSRVHQDQCSRSMRNKNEFAHGVWRAASRVWEIFCESPLTGLHWPDGLSTPQMTGLAQPLPS